MENCSGEKQFLQALEKYFDVSDYEGHYKDELAERKSYLRQMVSKCSNLTTKLAQMKEQTFPNKEFERFSRAYLLDIYMSLDPPCLYDWSGTPYGEVENVKVANPFEGQL